MTCCASVRKQLGWRFGLIEILRVCRTADQHGNRANRDHAVPRLLPRHKFRCYACHSRPSPQQDRPRDVEQVPAFPNPYAKLPILGERQKGDVPAALLALATEVIE